MDRNKIVTKCAQSNGVLCCLVLTSRRLCFKKALSPPLDRVLTSTSSRLSTTFFHPNSIAQISFIALLLFIQSQTFNQCKYLIIFLKIQLPHILSLEKRRVMCHGSYIIRQQHLLIPQPPCRVDLTLSESIHILSKIIIMAAKQATTTRSVSISLSYQQSRAANIAHLIALTTF
jgi:hypothetical protein